MKVRYYIEDKIVTEAEFHSRRRELISIYGLCPVQTIKDLPNKINTYIISEKAAIEKLASHLK